MKNNKVAIVINPNKPGASKLSKKIRGWLKKRRISVRDNSADTIKELADWATLMICLGGDGTILSVARQVRSSSIPILGVNLGHLGFLTEFKDDEVFDALESFLKGKYEFEQRIILSCRAENLKTRRHMDLVALNDMVISREGLTKLLDVDVFISGEKLTAFRGDGLIIATPTGSTAYSLSAGGAIVHPHLDALIITPICPHASSLRPLVVRSDVSLTVKIRTIREGEKALLTADGQESFEIDDSYNVQITRARHTVKLLKNKKRSYVATLRENFRFPH